VAGGTRGILSEQPSSPDETASLVGQLIQGYRERQAEATEAAIVAVPGRVLGSDIEDQADELADGARRLTDLLTAFAREPARSLDAIAVFHGLSQAAESMAGAAAEMRRQEWFDLEDGAEPEAVAAWEGALEGLKSAVSTFKTATPRPSSSSALRNSTYALAASTPLNASPATPPETTRP
jgi:hypothetical protein